MIKAESNIQRKYYWLKKALYNHI